MPFCLPLFDRSTICHKIDTVFSRISFYLIAEIQDEMQYKVCFGGSFVRLRKTGLMFFGGFGFGGIADSVSEVGFSMGMHPGGSNYPCCHLTIFCESAVLF